MNPFLSGFKAAKAGRRAIYSFLQNLDNCTPATERESEMLFNQAEQLRGHEDWLKNAQSTGAKAKPLAEAGSKHHKLEPDLTQKPWSRVDMGSMHFLGIVDNTFRSFLLSVAPVGARRVMSAAHRALRQPPGTKPITSFVKADPDDKSAKFYSAGEKLHQKQKWRRTMMLFDLYPLFPGDSEKDRRMRQVK